MQLDTDGCSVDASSKNDVASIKLDQCTQTETQAVGRSSIILENQLLNVIEDMKLDILKFCKRKLQLYRSLLIQARHRRWVLT